MIKKKADMHMDVLRSKIMGCKMKRSAWCVRCGKFCSVARAMVHIAGVPCIDYSCFGERHGKAGKTNYLCMTWARLRVLIKGACPGGRKCYKF